jgi:hypothetical protein
MGRITFRHWKAVKCKKANGREFIALYQGQICCKDSGGHIVWDGKDQYFIGEKRGDRIMEATKEEAEAIYKKIEDDFEYMLTHPKPANPNSDKKTETPKLKAKLKPEFLVTEVETPKPKVLSDFELLTADVGMI